MDDETTTAPTGTEKTKRTKKTGMKKRANGIASRHAILDATARIAGERGYDGTSIKAVSDLSGLPASSIYWHFKNKDELIAAVIDRSFTAWLEALRNRPPIDSHGEQALVDTYRHTALQLDRFPDFLRLGLMLSLERRPEETTARTLFTEVRAETRARLARDLGRGFPHLSDEEAERLAIFTLAASDGLFIAGQVEGIDLAESFETLARAVYAVAGRSESRSDVRHHEN